MCLAIKWSQKEKNKFLDDQDFVDGMITVYKVVGVEDNIYYPVCQDTRIPYDIGVSKADTTRDCEDSRERRYSSGYHFFYEKSRANEVLEHIKKWDSDPKKRAASEKKLNDDGEVLRDEYKVVKCKVKRSWIADIGTQERKIMITLVTKKAIFPDPRGEE